MKFAILVVGAAVFARGPGNAGVVLDITETSLSSNRTTTMTVSIDADRMQVRTVGREVTFRGDLNRMWIVNMERGTYDEITPETIERTDRLYARARAGLAAEQAPAMKSGTFIAPEPPPPQIRYLGADGGNSVDGMGCENYAKTYNGQNVESLCIAAIAEAGLVQQDFQVLDSMSRFVASEVVALLMNPVMASAFTASYDYLHWNDMNKDTGFSGLRLEITTFFRGQPVRRQTLMRVERVAIPVTEFDLPPGLRKNTIRQ